MGRGRRRTDRRGRAGRCRDAQASARFGPRQRRAAARAGQRAHPSRAVVAARPRAAGRRVHRLGQAADRDSRPAVERADDPAVQIAPIRDGDRARRARPARWRSATSAIRWRRSSAMRDGRLDGVVFHELLASRSATARWSNGRARRARAAAASRRRPRVAGAARAVFDVARAVQRDPRRGRRAAPCPITSVHLGESPEEVELLRDGQRPVARHARVHRRLARRLDAARAATRSSISIGLGVIDARTLVVHGVQFDDAGLGRLRGDRRHAGDLPAQQSVGRRRRAADRALLSRRACRSRSAPTAWRASSDLNLFSELKTMRWLAPACRPRRFSRARRSSARARWARTTSSAR